RSAGRGGRTVRAASPLHVPRARRVELPHGLDQVGRADDVVAIEHLAGLPADHLHRDPFGDAGAGEVADGGTPEVVEDAARHPGGAAGRRPRLVEGAERLAVRAREDVRDEASELAFTGARDRPPPFEQRPEVGREREHAPLAGLGGARLEPDLGGVEGDVRPAETGGFGPPAPARRVEERAEVQPHVAFDVEERALAVHAVVVEDVAHGGAEGRPGERRREDPHAVAAFQARFAHVSLARPADARRDRFRIARGLILVIDAVTEAAPPARGASPRPFAERTRLAGGRHLSGMIWRRAMDDDGSMIDEYLDAAGTVRTFRLAVYRDGQFLEAVERRDGARAGLRFVLP